MKAGLNYLQGASGPLEIIRRKIKFMENRTDYANTLFVGVLSYSGNHTSTNLLNGQEIFVLYVLNVLISHTYSNQGCGSAFIFPRAEDPALHSISGSGSSRGHFEEKTEKAKTNFVRLIRIRIEKNSWIRNRKK